VDPDEVILSKLCDAIVGYLKQHPDAADTARGIGNWWLPAERCDADARLIQRALDRLVEQGRVTRHALVDGTILYAREAKGGEAPRR
jgi:Fe2+ or Zn2+ uptake regulation protein